MPSLSAKASASSTDSADVVGSCPDFKKSVGNSPRASTCHEHAACAEYRTPPTFTIMQVVIHQASLLCTASRFMTDGRKHRSPNKKPTACPHIYGFHVLTLALTQAQHAHVTTTPGDVMPNYARNGQLSLCSQAVPERTAREVSFISEPNMYSAACRPETRPKTTQSSNELPPKRLLPWIPPATSPAAYNPLMGFPSAFTTNEFVSTSRPPIQ